MTCNRAMRALGATWKLMPSASVTWPAVTDCTVPFRRGCPLPPGAPDSVAAARVARGGGAAVGDGAAAWLVEEDFSPLDPQATLIIAIPTTATRSTKRIRLFLL